MVHLLELLTSPGVEPFSPGILGGVGRNKVMCDPATVGTASAGDLLAGIIVANRELKIELPDCTPENYSTSHFFALLEKEERKNGIPFFRRLLLRPLLSLSSGG